MNLTVVGYILLFLMWSLGMFILGYFIAKPYWYERGHYDGLDAADRYVKSRERARNNEYPRLGTYHRD